MMGHPSTQNPKPGKSALYPAAPMPPKLHPLHNEATHPYTETKERTKTARCPYQNEREN